MLNFSSFLVNFPKCWVRHEDKKKFNFTTGIAKLYANFSLVWPNFLYTLMYSREAKKTLRKICHDREKKKAAVI